VDLTVRAGEIVGLAGLMGAGRTELLETLFGVAGTGRRGGEVTVGGSPYRPRGPRSALARGVAFVPEDRRGAGLMLEHSVADNVVLAALSSLTTLGFVRRSVARRTVAEQLKALTVKAASPAVAVGTLSGGNQQKVVFAKQLLTRPRMLLNYEPTRGVDIGAKAEIYRLLHELADSGMAILLASSELPELLGVCDRVVVLYRGRTAAVLPRKTATQQAILAAAMGGEAKESR
jgi:ribose transport system ATP-binding protein